ncbi:MAG: hypothetical protein ACBZ72_09255 [Candidatus Bathyarchaeia archaeon]|jgi:hypothetical protein
MYVYAFDGTKVVLTEERLQHIALRHPESKNFAKLILDAVMTPDEVYVDSTGAFHALLCIAKDAPVGISDFLVVIYNVNGEGYKNGILYGF